MLVTTGIPITSTIHSEVIDIIDPKNKCHPLKNFPIQASFATGGLLQNEAPVICGGYTGNNKDSNMKCFIVDKSISFNHSIDLIYERTGSASVVLNNSQLWIAGGDPRKAMKMIHLGKCTTLVKMESVPPINLRKHVLGKSSTPLKNGKLFSSKK